MLIVCLTRETLDGKTWFQAHIVERLKCLGITCTKLLTMELKDVSGLWDLNEKKVEELLYLLVFGVLEVKYDLDRKGMKI